MINLVFLNNALGKVKPSEFEVLYFIANNLSLRNTTRARIYRDQIADKLNICPRQVSRLTDALVEKGFLKKDEIAGSSVKSVCYYSLVTDENDDESEQEPNSKVDKNVSLKKNINNKKGNINKFKLESKEQSTKSEEDFLDYIDAFESK